MQFVDGAIYIVNPAMAAPSLGIMRVTSHVKKRLDAVEDAVITHVLPSLLDYNAIVNERRCEELRAGTNAQNAHCDETKDQREKREAPYQCQPLPIATAAS